MVAGDAGPIALNAITFGFKDLSGPRPCDGTAGRETLSDKNAAIHIEDDRARAGETPGVVRRVLGFGLGITILALSAAGGTPYTCHVAEGARRLGATVVSIANNPDTRLLRAAQSPICLETPPEVLAGSTRMGAGTAQKAALNLISTLAGSLLGHIFEGLMVNVLADNTKLRARTARMVAQITGAPAAKSEAALTQAEGRAKPAILIASGASPTDAASLLETHKGHLGPALAALQT